MTLRVQTLLALAWLLLALFSTVLAQLYSDQIPNYPDICTLTDLGFQLLPLDVSPTVPNVMNLVSIGVFLLYALFLTRRPQLVIRRFLWLWGAGFWLRALAVSVTRLPRSPTFLVGNYTPSNIFVGALRVLIGQESTITDFMFSGHTYAWILTGLMLGRYSNHGFFSALFWAFNATGIVLLVASRMHYTADCIVAIYLAVLLFLVYHLFLDQRYLQRWDPALVFPLTPDALDKRHSYPLPLTVRDASNRVVAEVPAPLASRLPGERWVLQPGRETTRARVGVFQAAKWLDGE